MTTKTIVLDDDPTGTQSVSGATVLLRPDAAAIADVLSEHDSVYVQTNSRALGEREAADLARRLRADGLAAASEHTVRFVLRGDSTLRGHVFAESEVFLDDDAVMLFVPAFPDGGRTTREGIHYVRVGDRDVPAHETEYAADPVFPFRTSGLTEYVAEKSGRIGVPVALADVRAGGLVETLRSAPAGSVVVPDAVDAVDIRLIARAVEDTSRRVVVRSASPLAAELAGVASSGLLPTPIERPNGRVLIACGSHTAGASAQLDRVARRIGRPAIIDTEAALADPARAGRSAAAAAPGTASDALFVTTARERSAAHNTLAHGERVMTALTSAVRALLPDVSTVVAKGGITSAEVARTGIGAERAEVLGQILPGISVWRMRAHDARTVLYVVVPGNVGGPDTLVDVLAALGVT